MCPFSSLVLFATRSQKLSPVLIVDSGGREREEEGEGKGRNRERKGEGETESLLGCVVCKNPYLPYSN